MLSINYKYKCLLGLGVLKAITVKSMDLWLSMSPAFLLALFFYPENEYDLFFRNSTLFKVHSVTTKEIVLFLDVVCIFCRFLPTPK
jgi:hypothetical protein